MKIIMLSFILLVLCSCKTVDSSMNGNSTQTLNHAEKAFTQLDTPDTALNVTYSQHKAVLAVMDIQSTSDQFNTEALQRATEYLRGKIAASNKYHVIASDTQHRTLTGLMKKNSHLEKYEKSTQIELGQALAANLIVSVSITRFTTRYSINAEIIDLKKEVSIIGASVDFGTIDDFGSAVLIIASKLCGDNNFNTYTINTAATDHFTKNFTDTALQQHTNCSQNAAKNTYISNTGIYNNQQQLTPKEPVSMNEYFFQWNLTGAKVHNNNTTELYIEIHTVHTYEFPRTLGTFTLVDSTTGKSYTAVTPLPEYSKTLPYLYTGQLYQFTITFPVTIDPSHQYNLYETGAILTKNLSLEHFEFY